MKYIEGMDYWVRYVQFPNMASESVAASHGDGTFTIYINTLFPPERQEERLRHELEHLEQEHFYRDGLTISQIERQAEGLIPALPAAWGEDGQRSERALADRREREMRSLRERCGGVVLSEGAGSPAPADCRVLPGPPPSFVAVRWDGQPAEVSFGFRVPDESLLPHFRPGELLCCDSAALSPGDVGLFQYRGATVCRQYQKDALGITYLFALDRARPQEDILVPAGDERTLLCLGRVRTEVRIPLPGR